MALYKIGGVTRSTRLCYLRVLSARIKWLGVAQSASAVAAASGLSNWQTSLPQDLARPLENEDMATL